MDPITVAEPFNGPRTDDLDTATRRVADTLHRLNLLIHKAVEAGVSVELIRVHRVHNGRGQWGDQMVPVVMLPDKPSKE